MTTLHRPSTHLSSDSDIHYLFMMYKAVLQQEQAVLTCCSLCNCVKNWLNGKRFGL